MNTFECQCGKITSHERIIRVILFWSNANEFVITATIINLFQDHGHPAYVKHKYLSKDLQYSTCLLKNTADTMNLCGVFAAAANYRVSFRYFTFSCLFGHCVSRHWSISSVCQQNHFASLQSDWGNSTARMGQFGPMGNWRKASFQKCNNELINFCTKFTWYQHPVGVSLPQL